MEATADGDKIRFTKQPFVEDVGPQKIKSIQFSMSSGTEIRNSAELQVYHSRLYDPNRKPIENGLLDPRLGPASKHGFCATCHGSFNDCPGHFGYLKLALPVFNVGYFSTILNILKCICKSCARVLLLEEERVEFLKKMRNPKAEMLQKNALVKKIIARCKADKCSRCGCINGFVKKAAIILAIVHDSSKVLDGSWDECTSAMSHTKESKANLHMDNVLNPVRVLALFERMLDEDCELLHLYDRPEKLIHTDIPVPPVAIRPSVFMDSGSMSNEDDITSRLAKIVHANSRVREDLQGGISPSKCLEDWHLLQYEVYLYINSEVRGVPSSMQQAKPLRGFVQRLKGKQGRFRGNLSGKRVEFTGRTVISPDPNLKITEVAIPILMARILTYPERVSRYNIEKLRQCVRNGAGKYPGANFLLLPDGSRVNLKHQSRYRHADELKSDYIVERHLEDGDIVLFNRQPSLHRMSIMSHRARIMPWKTLRFNESVCNPYNADFDGDEMNLHVPQTEEARTEALMLMGVQNNLCTPKNGEILVASTQDFLTSSFLITRKDTFYDRDTFCLMCSFMGDVMEHIDLPTPALIKPMELWTGKQIFSVLIRPQAHMRVYVNLTVVEKNYSKSRETMCPKDGYVYFRNSELICGQLGKATLGNGNKDGLYSVLLRDYNAHAAAACMNRLAKLSARWIGDHGFSIGIEDVQPGEHLNHQKKTTIEKGYEECDNLILSYNKGTLALQSGCNAAQTLESRITGVLNKVRDTAANVCMDTLHWRNSPLIMSCCGSKGSPINISQMVACVGQQSVGGRRAPDGFINRTLPHFHRNSKTPAAKGFVANSFYSGLTPTEFLFHTMGGREGLVDTAVKTAETGYMSRRLMKALEDLSIHYDETVRNASGGIVQFHYGDDGMDPAKMEGKSGTPLNLDRLFMKIQATCPTTNASISLSPSEISQYANDRLSKHDATPEGGCSSAFKQMLLDFIHEKIATLRNIRRILQIDDNYGGDSDGDMLQTIAANIFSISSRQLQVFLEACISRYHLKRIEAGTAIGAIGAQSIGEPGTQMTLKTFHFAGVASMNITQGVPRIKEIINAAKNISTPIITAKLVYDNDEKSARIVKCRIEKTVLGEKRRVQPITIEPTTERQLVTSSNPGC
ncbi:DNA-directed RNA polymerase III subunit 1-like isoform X2 [Tasmannia lanceolata]|uniref:DNA-directed RNA polymerase III subunit 1-like isoform X2 n=1 Tax=Tasmannia lanceolata TaxID=3420 RepID=UPI0040641747